MMIITGFDKLYRLQIMKHSWGSWEQQNCGFALFHSIFQSLPACFPYIMEERHSWCCHTLTNILSCTILNDCGQLPSCSHLTVSVWWSLYGISDCNRKQNHLGMEDGWFFLSLFYLHFDKSLFFFPFIFHILFCVNCYLYLHLHS